MFCGIAKNCFCTEESPLSTSGKLSLWDSKRYFQPIFKQFQHCTLLLLMCSRATAHWKPHFFINCIFLDTLSLWMFLLKSLKKHEIKHFLKPPNSEKTLNLLNLNVKIVELHCWGTSISSFLKIRFLISRLVNEQKTLNF